MESSDCCLSFHCVVHSCMSSNISLILSTASISTSNAILSPYPDLLYVLSLTPPPNAHPNPTLNSAKEERKDWACGTASGGEAGWMEDS